MDKHGKLQLLSLILIVGVTFNVGFHYIHGFYLEQPYPRNTFLFDPSKYGTDFEDVVRDGHTLNPYLEYSSAQFPFLALIGYAFSVLSRFSYASFLLTSSLAYVILTAAHVRTGDWIVTSTFVFVLAFLSYPFMFAIDRGNFEILVAVFLLAFSFLFMRGKYFASAVALSFAIALKLFPAIFLILFLPVRRYRAMAVSVACAAALTLGSLMVFQGGLAANVSFLLHGSNLGANPIFVAFTSLSSNMVQRGVSLLTLLKIISFESGLFQDIDPTRFLRDYILVASLAGVLTCAYVWARERVLWKQATVLTSAMLLLPHISADYKLLHVFVPLYLFVNCKTRSKWDALYLSLFGLLLIPKDYLYLSKVVSDVPGAHDVSIAVPANIVILVAMTLLVVVSGLIRRAPAARADEFPTRAEEPSSEAISL